MVDTHHHLFSREFQTLNSGLPAYAANSCTQLAITLLTCFFLFSSTRSNPVSNTNNKLDNPTERRQAMGHHYDGGGGVGIACWDHAASYGKEMQRKKGR